MPFLWPVNPESTTHLNAEEKGQKTKGEEKKFNKNRFASQNILSLLRRYELNSQERFHWEKGIVLENGVCAFAKSMWDPGPQNALTSSVRSENSPLGLVTFEP